MPATWSLDMPNNYFELLLYIAILALIICPAKYDPAIRIKEFNERRFCSRKDR
jgi:hypothetical protein